MISSTAYMYLSFTAQESPQLLSEVDSWQKVPFTSTVQPAVLASVETTQATRSTANSRSLGLGGGSQVAATCKGFQE